MYMDYGMWADAEARAGFEESKLYGESVET